MKSPHRYSVHIRESHLDTFEHVNNATYLVLFEEARWEWITANGYGLQKVRETGLGPVILDLRLRFLKELTLREDITICSLTESYEQKIGKVKQWMENSSGERCCEAEFTFALFDLSGRKIVSPTEDWLKAVGLSAS